MLHFHVFSWAAALVLFFLTYTLYKRKNKKISRILHMILRLLYITTIFSGGMLIYQWIQAGAVNMGPLIIKGILGLAVIGLFEVMLLGAKRNEDKKSRWITLILALALVFYYGYSVLPMHF
ncbi:DUF1516 family protein [Fictibacillus enclensis]|uniref:Uncharacterized protein n=1 Tax=Fictibacillus enclensis TaxID=1017270 RepID=A0A0V8JCX3_9BACL|nr:MULTISPECIES: DUF1516 family protein [Fictibacillus]KSU84797.1 hypothetical protein AS030_04520 [Fictibacillus enclensis]MDM5198561.1 DUF1516 family protein [Fictibacillus enclensis]MDM5337761.1 DUF1516 family protein [Fictibacillus enclensis]RXY99547.1 DUF1516 domain-containing protein [Fictibacillus sp. S7]WHY74126.1 DUF1516 family protein [Fictibacillus enclensis]